ncbi:MAG TPA: hypothetical protein ACFCUC_10600 [Desulfobacterales bacterium]
MKTQRKRKPPVKKPPNHPQKPPVKEPPPEDPDPAPPQPPVRPPPVKEPPSRPQKPPVEEPPPKDPNRKPPGQPDPPVRSAIQGHATGKQQSGCCPVALRKIPGTGVADRQQYRLSEQPPS